MTPSRACGRSTPINPARHHDLGRRSANISRILPRPAISTTTPSVIADETMPTITVQ